MAGKKRNKNSEYNNNSKILQCVKKVLILQIT